MITREYEIQNFNIHNVAISLSVAKYDNSKQHEMQWILVQKVKTYCLDSWLDFITIKVKQSVFKNLPIKELFYQIQTLGSAFKIIKHAKAIKENGKNTPIKWFRFLCLNPEKYYIHWSSFSS